MPLAPPSDRELDAYREQADRFIAELDEEFYLHYAGLKDTFDLTPIYERHANLTELEQVQSIGLAANGGARVRERWRFACEGYFGDLTRDHAEKLAELEAELSVTVDGEDIPYRVVRAGPGADARRPRHRPAVPAERHARPRRAAEQEPTCVLRADRGARPRSARQPADRRSRRLEGRPRRGRPHRARRAHVARALDGAV